MDPVQVFKTKQEEIETHENRIPRAGWRFVVLESGVGCVYLSGRLDILGVQQIEMKFTMITSTQRESVIVDLTEVELLTSIGLGMLIANANALNANGKRMVLINPQPRVERVIRISGLDQILPIANSLHEAYGLIKDCEAA
jgi:anti-anti-sigma factor